MKSVIIIFALSLISYPVSSISVAETLPLKVKGFYLGMEFDKSKENAQKLFKGIDPDLKIEEISLGVSGPYLYGVDSRDKKFGDFRKCSIRVTKDVKGKLASVNISGELVDILFNVRGMDIKTFLNEFQKNYGTPEFHPETVDVIEGMWKVRKTRYKSLNEEYRYAVWISEDKTIEIEYVDKKFDRSI